MVNLTFWEWFFKSFYSRKVIAYSRFRPITTTIGYVLFIVFIASIPYFVSLNMATYTGVDRLNHLLVSDLPSFQLINGSLQLDRTEPFYTEELGEGFVLIDPANFYSDEDLKLLNEGIALQQHNILFVANGNIQSISYTLLGLNELTKEELAKRIQDLQGFLPILLFIVTTLLYVGLSGLAYLGISILAFIATFFKRGRPLQYRHFWTITAHALTLPVIVLYWIDILVTPIPFSAFVLSTLLLVFMAVHTIPIPKRKASTKP
ncbi:DUF1189 domain-containing protein [Halalkalibacter alkalisediminis]|uniref:DUF1189 domain-containing protein n=1 Tax=Halalkalibacter alkalisediminis TaxID=935616 RepID=A0ABV6NBF2_9BACI|nr:DUF1189 domain-containing protein [Halalkalibacter alkalisediminis]